MYMSRLGKSFKNRFLRRALAMVLAGTMVLSGMPVSFAAETSDAETAVETEVQGGTEETSEEAAGKNEVVQQESEEETESRKTTEETETAPQENESAKPDEESEKVFAKESVAAEENQETASADSEGTTVSSEIEETETTETGTEETETEETTTEEENEAVVYASDSAALAEGHENAKWGTDGTLLKNDGTSAVDSQSKPVLQSGNKGIYKNEAGDILYIDTAGSNGNGKFAPTSSNGIQIRNTKIYVPVKIDKDGRAKIIIYQNSIKNEADIFDNTKSTYLALSKDDVKLSSEVACTAFTTSSIELTITLNDSKNTSAVICMEVIGIDIYFTKIISGEEVRDDVYDDSEGASEELVKYNMEGYAGAYGVTGGGVMKATAENYYKVSTADAFVKALKEIKTKAEPAVIKVEADLNLGSKEFKEINISSYDVNLIKADAFQALCHPTLKDSGVSDLLLTGFKDLTIFSTNGAAIKHCDIILKQSENIIFRNLVFDELWEWDDLVYYKADKTTKQEVLDSNGKRQLSHGDYDRNDWDYICVDQDSDGVWIDHCTFYKAYDGVIDVKNPKDNGEERVTISWCKFEEKSAPDGNGNHPFYDKQIEWLKENINNTQYYRALMAGKGTEVSVQSTNGETFATDKNDTITGEGFTDELIISYSRGQKKTHLFGQDDKKENAEGIRATLANNYYNNSMDRMPRLRFGTAHEYNCVLDSSIFYAAKKAAGTMLDGKLAGNGAISTMGGALFLDSCYLDGIIYPLNSGNGNSAPGYIGWNHCKYVLDSEESELEIAYKNKSDTDTTNYHLTKSAFEAKLPAGYKYNTYEGELDNLASYLSDKAGAGVVTMTDIQWTKTSYGKSDGNGGGAEDPPTPPTPPNPGDETELEKMELSADDFATGDIETNTTKNDFTIKATSTAKVSIVANASAVELDNGKKIANNIKLGGAGKIDSRSIYFDAPAAGTLTVYAASGSKGTARPLAVKNSEFQEIAGLSKNVNELEKLTYSIAEAGGYYIASADSNILVYYIVFAYKPEGGDNPNPGDDMVTETLKFRADDLTVGALSADVSAEGDKYFTVKTASSASGNEVKAGEATIGSEKFKQYIKLNGAAKTSDRSIEIKALGSGTLTIYAKSSNDTDARTVNLLGADGKAVAGQSKDGVLSATSFTLQIPEKGTYYVGSSSGGLYIYGIDFEVTYKKGESFDPDPTDADFPTFTAPTGDSEYGADEGNDPSKVIYNMEGYAAAANVTGGGLLKDDGTSGNYHKVTNEKEFLAALKAVQNVTDKPNVIEITADLNLGDKELKNNFDLNIYNAGSGDYSGVIRAYKDTQQPLKHPTLMEKTGVAFIKLHNFHNLTIFSKNGAAIKHAGILFEGGTDNVIIRNLTFDELWEWDDIQNDKGEYGSYDRNDWDYITIEDDAEGIWIDHCTFYKAYDGILDMKNKANGKGYQRVTVSWCEFLPGSKDNTFFNKQMQWLEENIDSTTYYKQLRQTENMSKEAVWWYAYGQKKTHLFGSDDKDAQDKAIRATLANNYYKNSMDRMPRLRYGKVHEYNCILDAQNLQTHKNAHITSNGAISTCNGEMLLENCYIRGIEKPLNSGNGSSPTGYINAIGSVYYLAGENKTLEPKKNGSGSGECLTTDAVKFQTELLYNDYITYDATKLFEKVMPSAGAGKLNMSTVQWEKTGYGSRTGSEGGTTSAPAAAEPAGPNDEPPKMAWDETEAPGPNPPTTDPDPTEEALVLTVKPADTAEFEFDAKDKTVSFECAVKDAKIYYTMGDTESGLTDPADSANTNRVEYSTSIQITKETYIWAVAVKADKTGEPLKCHYTVLAEGEVAKPVAKPGSETAATEVAAGTKIELSASGDADIYYTMGSTPDDAKDPTLEDSGRRTYDKDAGIVITEAVTIKAAAHKNGKYSKPAVFTYTVKTDDPADEGKAEKPKAAPEAGAVKKGTEVHLSSDTKDAVIYYTTNGDAPTKEDKNLYKDEEPIVITEALTIKAFAAKEGLTDSDAAEFAYTILSDALSDYEDDPGRAPDNAQEELSDIWITGLEKSYAYTGAKITPDIKVWDCDIEGNDRLLAPGIDYAAAYKNNVNPGSSAEVVVTGKGNYAGQVVSEKFSIVKAADVENPVDVKGAKIDKIPNKSYTGAPQYPDFKLMLKGKLIGEYVENTDFTENKSPYKRKDGAPMDINVAVSNNVNKGTAAILVSGKGGTSVKAAFKITQADISGVTVTATAAEYAVKGAVPGSLTVKQGDKLLLAGRDYTAKYSNNKKTGTGTVTITGKGNYKGKKPASYTIDALDMSEISVNAVTACENVKAGKVKAAVVDKDGNALKPAQYTLNIYKDAKGDSKYRAADTLKAGDTIYVEAAAKDTANLAGKTQKEPFTVGKDISKAKFTLVYKDKKGIPYTGSAIELEAADLDVTMRGVSGKLKLKPKENPVEGEDYDFEIVAYANNINKGTATAVVRGIGKYSGTKTIKFKIAQKTMKKGTKTAK